MSALKALRISKKLTQQQACKILGVSLRSYKEYENDESKADTLKYRFMMEELEKYVAVDEEHGLLSIEDIRAACKDVFKEYEIEYCILFGSYAKGNPTEQSDVDLLVSTGVTGLRFYGIAERLRNRLCKKVDLLDLNQLLGNRELLDAILKDGIKVYEK